MTKPLVYIFTLIICELLFFKYIYSLRDDDNENNEFNLKNEAKLLRSAKTVALLESAEAITSNQQIFISFFL